MGTKKLLRLMTVAAVTIFMSTAQAQTVNVTGKYIYHNDIQSPLSDLKVKLINQTNQVVATTITNSDGIYSFTNVPTGEYSIQASTDQPSHGYTMQDCFSVLQHISGFLPLDNIQLLAADVDNNNIVDRDDLNLMNAAWTKPSIKFPAGDWKFETPHFTVNGTKRAEEDIPIPPASGSSSGDLGSVYAPGSKPNNMLNLGFANTNNTINSVVELPVSISSTVPATGLGVIINCPSNFKIDEVIPSIAGLNISITGQTIRANWLDASMKPLNLEKNTTLFVIKGKSTNGNESIFSLGESSHLISKSGGMDYSAKIELPKLSLQKSESFAFALKGNFPNPFAGSTRIEYTLPASGNVEMKIFNIQGQLVATPIKAFQVAGVKELPFDGNSLQSGIYFCTISLKSDKIYSATSRMILSR